MKICRYSASALLAGVALPIVALNSAPAFAQSVTDRNLSDVSSQTSGSCAVLTVNFNIRVQILSYFPQTSGRELRINLTALDNAARGRESLRPPQGVSALRSIELESNAGSGAVLSLHFTQDMEFSVAAGERPQTLIISISQPGSGGCQTTAPSSVPPVTVPQTSPETGTPETGVPTAAAPRPAVVIPRGLYVVNVVSQPADVTNLNDAQRSALGDLVTYETQFERDGQTWHRLRSGFFVSRAQAEAARQRLVALFPEAWVVAVTAQEREQGVVSRLTLTPQVAAVDAAPVATAIVAAQPLTPEQQTAVTTAEHDAEEALRAGDNDRAIALLTQLLTFPENELTPRALELLGLTRERKGQMAHARAEYDEYLRRYPTSEGADRIRQRLAALDAPGTAAPEVLRAASGDAAAARQAWRWGARGSFSQFYFRDQSSTRFVDASRIDPTAEVDNSVNLNQLLTAADLSLTGGNDRTQILLRSSGSFTKNFRTGGRDITTLTALYFDVQDDRANVSARLGRQTRNGNGIFGRFDGAFVGVGIQPGLRVNLAAGYPVASSRQTRVVTDRRFVGVSVDIGSRADPLQATLYGFNQSSHGLIDRRAVGAELRYLVGSFNAYGILDYDVHYNRLNLAVMTLNYTMADQSAFSLTADYRQSPLLTTGNALIGQTQPGGLAALRHLGELRSFFTDPQIYQIARDNTLVSKSLTIAYSRPITANLQGNLDFSVTDTGGTNGTTLVTPGSFPIDPQPAVGREYYYGSQLVGTGLIFNNDIYVFSGRFSNTQRSHTYTLDFNARVPVTTALRVSPRIRYGARSDKFTDATFSQIQPTLRINYYPMRGSEVELELGGNFSRQRATVGTALTTTRETGVLISLGYRLDF